MDGKEKRRNWETEEKEDSAPRSLHSLPGATKISTFPDIKPKPFRINHISIENLNKSMNGSNKNTPFSFSSPSTQPNGTLPRPNNEILNANLLDEGFTIVIGRRGGFFSGVCCTCAPGGAVGSDDTSHPRTPRRPRTLIRRTRRGVHGRSFRFKCGRLCRRCVVAAWRLRG